jgi:hypothetical protein
VSVEEQPCYRKIKDKQSKTLLAHAFQAQSAIQVSQLNNKIQDFYGKDSIETAIPFKHLYSNYGSCESWSIEAK